MIIHPFTFLVIWIDFGVDSSPPVSFTLSATFDPLQLDVSTFDDWFLVRLHRRMIVLQNWNADLK